VYVGANKASALAAGAIAVTQTTGTASVTVPAQGSSTTEVYLFVTVVTPNGVTGPAVQSTAVPVYVYKVPTSLSYMAPVTYTLTPVSLTVTADGLTPQVPGSLAIYASKTSGDQAPVLVSAPTALSASGTATVTATFPSAGTWYVVARWYDASGVIAGSLTQAVSGLAVSDYEMPLVGTTSIPKLLPNTATQCTLVLTDPNKASMTTANIKVTIGSAVATLLTYTQATATLGFTLTAPLGFWPVSVLLTAPNSTFTVTRDLGSYLVDPFVYPTSVSVSPALLVSGAASSATVTLSPTPSQSVQCSVYVGANKASALAAGAIAVTQTTGTASVTVPAQAAGQVYLFVTVVTPSGVTGPAVQSAAVPVYSYVHATSVVSYTPTTLLNMTQTNMSVRLGGYDTNLASTASVYYATTNSSVSPTLLGTAAIVGGVVTVSATIPTGTYYLYARTIDPGSSVQGPSLVSEQAFGSFGSTDYNKIMGALALGERLYVYKRGASLDMPSPYVVTSFNTSLMSYDVNLAGAGPSLYTAFLYAKPPNLDPSIYAGFDIGTKYVLHLTIDTTLLPTTSTSINILTMTQSYPHGLNYSYAVGYGDPAILYTPGSGIWACENGNVANKLLDPISVPIGPTADVIFCNDVSASGGSFVRVVSGTTVRESVMSNHWAGANASAAFHRSVTRAVFSYSSGTVKDLMLQVSGLW
jgi:hypothetical protein